jgi:hypothetical protein
MNPRYAIVALRAEYRCEYWRAPQAVFNLPLEVEHILPLALGGPDASANLALACRSCNLYKAAHTSGHDATQDARVRLFNPREDRWDEHFQVDLENGDILGISPVGRATVFRLRMNHAGQASARQQWMRLGLFP